jgi:hypothetical protein
MAPVVQTVVPVQPAALVPLQAVPAVFGMQAAPMTTYTPSSMTYTVVAPQAFTAVPTAQFVQPSAAVMPTAMFAPQAAFGIAAPQATCVPAMPAAPSVAQLQDQAARMQAEASRLQGEIAKAQAAQVVMAHAQAQAAQAQAQAAQAELARAQDAYARATQASPQAAPVAPPQAPTPAAPVGCSPNDLPCRITALEKRCSDIEGNIQRLMQLSERIANQLEQH